MDVISPRPEGPCPFSKIAKKNKTLFCYRLKLGDRFFYDLDVDPNVKFSPRQLQEIRKTSLARIICDNTDSIKKIQPMVFKLPDSSRTNAVVDCNSPLQLIPSVDLTVFRQARRLGR